MFSPSVSSRHSALSVERGMPIRPHSLHSSAIQMDAMRQIQQETDENSQSLSVPNSAKKSQSSVSRVPLQPNFASHLAQSLFSVDADDLGSKILTFKEKAPKPTEDADSQSALRGIYSQNKEFQSFSSATLTASSVSTALYGKQTFRFIPSTPEKILDAPGLVDDFYRNVIDWSLDNVLAVALGGAVYLWNATSASIDFLMETKESDDYVTAVQWMGDNVHLAIATFNHSDIQLWNTSQKKKIRSMKGHLGRVGTLAWNPSPAHSYSLSSGSKDSMIFHHDIRIREHVTSVLKGHQQEICGLKWNSDGSQLASGGNDNLCCIWDLGKSSARHVLTDSNAAIKALSWAPFQRNLLATGSGAADRHIRFYNSTTGALENSIDTDSQVLSLQWSKNSNERELLSSHGYNKNQLSVWKYPTLMKVADLNGHTKRVLHTAVSPDGSIVCSAAGDETLRFWKVWEGEKSAVSIGGMGGAIAANSREGIAKKKALLGGIGSVAAGEGEANHSVKSKLNIHIR